MSIIILLKVLNWLQPNLNLSIYLSKARSSNTINIQLVGLDPSSRCKNRESCVQLLGSQFSYTFRQFSPWFLILRLGNQTRLFFTCIQSIHVPRRHRRNVSSSTDCLFSLRPT